MDKKLENYIKLSRETGVSDEQIKQELLESKAGWTEEDINQAFSPNVSSTNSQIPKPKSFWKYISILGIVVVLGVVGSFSYYYFYVDSGRDSNGEVNENNGGDVSTSESPSDEIKDCGVTEFMVKHDEDLLQSLQSESTLEELNQDEVMVCLGENILNCEKSKAIFKTIGMGDIKFIVEGTENNGICNIRTEYGDVDQIQSEEQKQYANTYISCPVNINDVLKEAEKNGFSKDKIDKIIGSLPISMYFYLGINSFAPEEESGCTKGLMP